MSQSHLSAEITEAKSCLLSTQQEGIAEKLISAPSLRSPPHTVSFGPVREDRKWLFYAQLIDHLEAPWHTVLPNTKSAISTH